MSERFFMRFGFLIVVIMSFVMSLLVYQYFDRGIEKVQKDVQVFSDWGEKYDLPLIIK